MSFTLPFTAMIGLACELNFTRRADLFDWRDLPESLQKAMFESWAWQKTGDSAWLTIGNGFNPLLQEDRRNRKNVNKRIRIMDAKLQRFTAICRELDIDSNKLMSSNMPVLPGLLKEWNDGQLDDIRLTRMLRNLAIFNPGIKIDG